MKPLFLVWSAILFLSAPVFGAEELTDEKKQLIDEFLSLTGGDRMGELFARYYIQEISMDVLKQNPDIDKRAFTIIEQEVNGVIRQAVDNDRAILELSYPIYHKYLSSADIVELIRFYRSPIGQKTMELLPTISKEAMQAGETWGRSLGPAIQQRIQQRLNQESITIQQ